MKTFTPSGVRDWLPEEYANFQSIIKPLQALFDQKGFATLKTPGIEYYDSLLPGLGEPLKAACVKFVGPTGDLMVFRPDHTAAIARMVSQRRADCSIPAYYSYFDPVYRLPDVTGLADMELFQAGVECLGDTDVQSDVDVLALAIQSLLDLGLNDFRFDVADVSFCDRLNKDQKRALAGHDYVSFGSIAQRGGVELIQDDQRLLLLYEGLKKKGLAGYIQFNLGLVKPYDYYTGLVFEGYLPGLKQAVIRGGRYDGLMARFGEGCPAIGFSVQLNELERRGLC